MQKKTVAYHPILIQSLERSFECTGFSTSSETLNIDGALNGIEANIGSDLIEEDQFYYHPDLPMAIGIGSSSWISDVSGGAYQLPIAIGIGAGYYNSDISIWLSVDPMASKYPNETAYCYAGLNPIMIRDP